VKSQGPNRGTCSPLDQNPAKSVWNQPCNEFVSSWALGLVGAVGDVPVPELGVNDKMVCGKPVFYENGTFDFYEWLGFCDQGQCKQCASVGQYLGPSMALMMHGDPSFLLCVGRECTGGKLAIADYAVDTSAPDYNPTVNVDLPTGIEAAILVFVIFLCLMNGTTCICSLKSRFDKMKYKRLPQRV